MENTELQTAETLNADTKRLYSEIKEMMVRINIHTVENIKLLDLSQKSILLALGQKVILNTPDYSGSLRPIAEQLVKDSDQLATNLRASEATRDCQDVMLEIMQLAMVNKEVIDIGTSYSAVHDTATISVVKKGGYKECNYENAPYLLYETVFLSEGFSEPLKELLDIEDKLLELIADAKDKAEVAA